MASEPPQPDQSEWGFVEDLKSPVWHHIPRATRSPEPEEIDLRDGVELCINAQSPLLEAVCDDLRAFLAAARIPHGKGYRIVINADLRSDRQEAYMIDASESECIVSGSDIEGIRRGIYFLEDELLRGEGVYLKKGRRERYAVVKTRISRCFFGPTRRPPYNRDELMDEIDYYPDAYLNKLAYEGVNGLWLTVHLDEVCHSSVLPEINPDIDRRLAKLRMVVEKCARYGIRIYLFCNEPRPQRPDHPWFQANPELKGAPMFDGVHYHFCTSSDTARAYLEEALYNLFSNVPGLGGMINITVGEGLSHCCSDVIERKKGCPRCAHRSHHEILREMLEVMERGIHRASPAAELISWPYFQFSIWGDDETAASAGEQPGGIILQHNFESSGEVEQCGRVHKISDYWLSWPGPSRLFVKCAGAAAKSGIRMGAKLQVGCSHEVATVPYVPVPGTLYQKYKAIHELGVSSVMQCWYFGNYPGLMTHAAGELSFGPFPECERDFLLALAKRHWRSDADKAVAAWDCFQKAYSHFPLNHVFGWFGPVHDAIVWPLYPEPVDLGISPSWLIAPPSGDRFGEPFAYTHSIEEIVYLTRTMAEQWESGAAILRTLLPRYLDDADRRKEIGVALALSIQFESAANVIEFYALRERLPYHSPAIRKETLSKMRKIVEREISQCTAMIDLCQNDPRLGFHSEAEGYKYFPEKLKWRRELLEALLAKELPRIGKEIESPLLWPAYTGMRPEGRTFLCGNEAGEFSELEEFSLPLPYRNSPYDIDKACLFSRWRAAHDGEKVTIEVICQSPAEIFGEPVISESIHVLIEPRRMWPVARFEITKSDKAALKVYPATLSEGWCFHTKKSDGAWTGILSVSFNVLRDAGWPDCPVRINIERRIMTVSGEVIQSWCQRNPLSERLVFADHNPADLGWLLFTSV